MNELESGSKNQVLVRIGPTSLVISGVPRRVEIHIREFLGIPRVNTLWAGDSRGITLTNSELETVTVYY
jgi:serine/threonine protein phosphatase PrpC